MVKAITKGLTYRIPKEYQKARYHHIGYLLFTAIILNNRAYQNLLDNLTEYLKYPREPAQQAYQKKTLEGCNRYYCCTVIVVCYCHYPKPLNRYNLSTLHLIWPTCNPATMQAYTYDLNRYNLLALLPCIFKVVGLLLWPLPATLNLQPQFQTIRPKLLRNFLGSS